MSNLTGRELIHALLVRLQKVYDFNEKCTIPEKAVKDNLSELCQGSRYGVEDVVKDLTGRGFAHIKNARDGRTFMFSPVFIGKAKDGSNIIFINEKKYKEYCLVCEICEKGFTEVGFEDHLLKAVNHPKHVQEEVDRITKRHRGDGKEEYVCPMPQCGYACTSKEEVEEHLHQKLKKVDLRTMEVEKIGRPVPFHCEICNVDQPAAMMNEHKKTRKHRLKLDELMKDKNEVEVLTNNEKAVNGFTAYLRDDTPATLNFCIKNLSQDSSVVLMECKALHDSSDVIFSQGCSDSTTEIQPEGEHTVTATYTCKRGEPHVMYILFNLKRGESDAFSVLREVTILREDDQKTKADGSKKKPQKDRGHTAGSRLEVVRSDQKPTFTETDQLRAVHKVDQYPLPPDLKQSLSNMHPKDEVPEELKLKDLTFENYADHFSKLLYMEEYQMDRDIKNYSMDDAKMTRDKSNETSKLHTLEVPGLADKRPSLLKGDRLFAIPSIPDGRKYEGLVHSVQQNSVSLGFDKKFGDSFSEDQRYKIEFRVNRMVLRVYHRAVTWAGKSERCSLKDVLFPKIEERSEIINPGEELEYKTEKINKEQKTAVEHILRGTSRPAPYLIYGPPGTGKTHTLVEAIKQVYAEIEESRILACAPQNSAADLITERLIEHKDVKKDDILRLNAKSRPYKNVKETVKDVSNYHGKPPEVYFPNKEQLKKYRIVVMTLVTSGRLVTGEIDKHFSHIFIDEAGQATEPQTVIPLAGLLDVNMANGGQVVLAGDPKQLGAVIRSSFAAEKLGTSLLERLMDRGLFQPTDEGYNPKYVSKLKESFRSHEHILKVPNDCFYDGELIPSCDSKMANKFCGWEELPTKGFPLIFHGVEGDERTSEKGHSWHNKDEREIVIDYVQKLKKSERVETEQIGIISPYLEQVKEILKDLPDMETRPTVGSVEKFQGDEKEVIIISTVRSRGKQVNLGFVKEAKRFNVAVTRAKALLIVVGNPEILSTNENWKRLIKYIRDHGGYRGCPLPPDFDKDDTTELPHPSSLSVQDSHEESDHDSEPLDLKEGSELQQVRDDTWPGHED